MPTSKSIRERILDCDETLTVDDFMEEDLLDFLPEGVREAFEALSVKWGPDRVWGEEPFLGRDDSITLGHKRGHHIAAHPEWAGWDEESAEEILRVEVQGTLLHELGHCIQKLAEKRSVDLLAQDLADAIKEAADEEGAVTSYAGHGKRDRAAEMFAEAFRWWVVAGDDFEGKYPLWTEAIGLAIELLDDWSAGEDEEEE